jgi:hypothetical protein
VAGGRRPALAHLLQRSRLAKSWTKVVGGWRSAARSTFRLVLQREHSISSHGYPLDPSIALKASQTIFPLSRDFCLILTNLEYAQNPLVSPLEKRTFARNYRNSMVSTHAFIRTRKLASPDVARVNRIIRARASRYIAAGRKEWLHPDQSEEWGDLRAVLLPPKRELYQYGGEMFAKFDDGRVYYQDAFVRTEKEREFLKKAAPSKPLRSKDLCGCGSGHDFGDCCEPRPCALRPTWTERSIRERNMMFLNALQNVLGLTEGWDWVAVRREMTDEKIKEIYLLYSDLWPEDTDLLQLLPKPDGILVGSEQFSEWIDRHLVLLCVGELFPWLRPNVS